MSIKITNVTSAGKSLNQKGEDFDLEINNRFNVQICACISDINREYLDVELICLNAEYGEAPIKPRYEKVIKEAIEDYAANNESDYRESEHSWLEHYSEM
tara:strand:- start:88 stop:387 length:300 start_codon:yes stop_codon:yes gene_type:complete